MAKTACRACRRGDHEACDFMEDNADAVDAGDFIDCYCSCYEKDPEMHTGEPDGEAAASDSSEDDRGEEEATDVQTLRQRTGDDNRRRFAILPRVPGVGVNVLAIDPGEVHVGMAAFTDLHCYKAWEAEPWRCIVTVRDQLEAGAIDVLVVESFRLYEDKAHDQVGSSFKTVELIGVLRYLVAVHSTTALLVEQGADIKKPMTAQLRARKIASMAKRDKAGGHALDAELHGYHYLFKSKERGEIVVD